MVTTRFEPRNAPWEIALFVVILGAGAIVFRAGEDLRDAWEDASGWKSVAVPEGTEIRIRLLGRVSTDESRAGDRFHAVVSSPVMIGERLAIPEGARVDGRVMLVERPGVKGGRGYLWLGYDRLCFGGERYEIGSRSAMYPGEADIRSVGTPAGEGMREAGAGTGDRARGNTDGAWSATARLQGRGFGLVFEPGTLLRFRLEHGVEVHPARL